MKGAGAKKLERAIAALAREHRGPGGAAAIVHEGQVIVRHTWGYANCEQAIPFTPSTLFRMCSITKQFTCALMRELFPDPSALDGDVKRALPELVGPSPGASHLANNQSGLRDYWALTALLGAQAGAPFSERESEMLIRGARTLQFEPGARYSYANTNFRLLASVLEDRCGRSFAELLRTRVFARVGMDTAFLAADTRAMPDGTEGYEGDLASGFRAADNRIFWTGDAGLGASLDDMIAWERFIDAAREDANSLYGRIANPTVFSNGEPARYANGLVHADTAGRRTIGHEGALRGWRSARAYLPSERLSGVVMMNHLAPVGLALTSLLNAALDEDGKAPSPVETRPDWLGVYVEPETGLSVRIDAGDAGNVRMRFGVLPEMLSLRMDGAASTPNAVLRPENGALWLERPGENLKTVLRRLEPWDGALDGEGRFRCRELNAELRVANAGGALYGAFSGALGAGRMEPLEPIGKDVWLWPCPRALDHHAPGDWTLAFKRDASGKANAVEVGCWLARRLTYERVK